MHANAESRRDFLALAIGAAAGSIAAKPAALVASDSAVQCAAGPNAAQYVGKGLHVVGVHPMSVEADRRTIVESPRHTPVIADVDVVIVGGGPTGVGAALAAGREGLKTLVVERAGALGGMWTTGLLNPFFDAYKGWIVEELVAELKKADAWRILPGFGSWKPLPFDVFDTERMKVLLETMLSQANVDFWYHTSMVDSIVENNCVKGVVVESKSGREAVLAKVVIDCSGDGDAAARAGIPFAMGRPEDELCQPMTLMFEIGGVDAAALQASTLPGKNFILTKAMNDAATQLKLPGKMSHDSPAMLLLPRRGAAVLQAVHAYKADGTNARDVTRAIVTNRREISEIVMPILNRIPGMENAKLLQTAPTVGVRESRHLEGRYTLDAADIEAARSFDDAITTRTFGIDIHQVYPGDKVKQRPFKAKVCEIPYRCMLPRSLGGLLFAGRCISGSHVAHASYRVTGTCMAMGQAAGLAAAMAIKANKSPGEVDGRKLHAALASRGVKFLSRRNAV